MHLFGKKQAFQITLLITSAALSTVMEKIVRGTVI